MEYYACFVIYWLSMRLVSVMSDIVHTYTVLYVRVCYPILFEISVRFQLSIHSMKIHEKCRGFHVALLSVACSAHVPFKNFHVLVVSVLDP